MTIGFLFGNFVFCMFLTWCWDMTDPYSKLHHIRNTAISICITALVWFLYHFGDMNI